MKNNLRGSVSPTHLIDFTIRWKKGEFRPLRLGQAFCNTFNVTDPDIYYADNDRAAQLITSKLQ